ncbi:hypothetical protein MBANPS3_002437 [Mucor bainieri]
MAPITALAEETLQMVFAHIDSTKQMAQCRLVCSRFNAIAEKAMFNCPVVINTEHQAFSLLQHLAKCQRKGIKNFHWGLSSSPSSSFSSSSSSSSTPQVFKYLLPLILTSKTVSITGAVQEQELYDLMDDIVDQLPEKPKLIALAHPEEPTEEYYRQLAQYGDTLQSAFVFLQDEGDLRKDYIDNVFDFPQLKSLVMKGKTISDGSLYSLLAGMHDTPMEDLTLDFQSIPELGPDRQVDYDWLQAHMEQNDRVKKLKLKGACNASYLATVIWIYPKLECITLDIDICKPMPCIDLLIELNHTLHCIADISQKELAYRSVDGHLLKQLIHYLNIKGLSINIPAEDYSISDVRMVVGGLKLVSRHFNAIAERAMFNCPVAVRTEDQAFSLLQHLAKCQRKGIENFHWGMLPSSSSPMPQVLKHLLPLILTSKTVSMTGVVQGETFYDLMDAIVEQLPEKPKLISLPHPQRDTEKYHHQLTQYRDTLQSIFIGPIQDFNSNEDSGIKTALEFPHLKSLSMKVHLSSMETLMQSPTFRRITTQLEELKLEFWVNQNPRAGRQMNHQQMLRTLVKTNVRMKRLTLIGDCPITCADAFISNCPMLESVTLDIGIHKPTKPYDLRDELNRIMRSLGNIAQKKLAITSVDGHLLKELIVYLDQRGCGIDISVIPMGGSHNIRIVVKNLN